MDGQGTQRCSSQAGKHPIYDLDPVAETFSLTGSRTSNGGMHADICI